MEKSNAPSSQQPLSQHHHMAHHVHPDPIYTQQPTVHGHQYPQSSQLQLQSNGAVHSQILQNQYQSNLNSLSSSTRSPLLDSHHDVYGSHAYDYNRHYPPNDNYYPHTSDRQDHHIDHNVNHEIMHNMPKGYNAEVYREYMKRNPPKDSNQIYQNHQTYRTHQNQHTPKPYIPISSRLGPQSNTEQLKRQYNEIQQMKLQQQMHYQNQAQMHQQQTFAERQMLLQHIHGIQPPPNLQNSIYSEGSYRDIDRYSSRNDFKDYGGPDMQKDADRYAKNNEYRETEKRGRQYPDPQWQSNAGYPADRRRPDVATSPPTDSAMSQAVTTTTTATGTTGTVSPLKSSESSSPSVKSPASRASDSTPTHRHPLIQRNPLAPVAIQGHLLKQGRDPLRLWKKRWFVLSEYCLFWYRTEQELKMLGTIILPSFTVTRCEEVRKWAFKLEHANVKTLMLAGIEPEDTAKWIKEITLATLMQNSESQAQSEQATTAAKTEERDEIHGPTYANAPPKPRRSNEGYNSPSPDMYDPNYDLLRSPPSHSQSTGKEPSTSYPINTAQDSSYPLPAQPPPPASQQPPSTVVQSKRTHDTHHLSLPLTNTNTERLESNQPSTFYRSNVELPYFDTMSRHQLQTQAAQQEPIYEPKYDRQAQSRNPYLQDPSQTETTSSDLQNMSTAREPDNTFYDTYKDGQQHPAFNSDMYGELNRPVNRSSGSMNDRIVGRRTPDAYGRASTGAIPKRKSGDYDDVYPPYPPEGTYGRTHHQKKLPTVPPTTNVHPRLPKVPQTAVVHHQLPAIPLTAMVNQQLPAVPPTAMGHHQLSAVPPTAVAHHQLPIVPTNAIVQQQPPQDYSSNYAHEKTFTGPSVLRRKKMQNNGIQPSVPRPHSADFLEYEAKNEMLNRTIPTRTVGDPPRRQPQRPKSSLDINSYYDPSSDMHYSQESYAEKMRQSAQYLRQQGLGARSSIPIPLEKYKSGLVEKQLNLPSTGNNYYETEFGSARRSREGVKHKNLGENHSNWTLKEKAMENQENRNGSVLSDVSTYTDVAQEVHRVEATEFMRSASARCPSSSGDTPLTGDQTSKNGESMKRLSDWKQRMLHSPLTRKGASAATSLARAQNQTSQPPKQPTRNDHYQTKSYANASYTSFSSDDEASMSVLKVDLSAKQLPHQKPTTNTTQHAGSNTSHGKIPVSAVTPRVRWRTDKRAIEQKMNDMQLSVSQQNLQTLTPSENSWMTVRSPSRTQQPIRAVSPRVRQTPDTFELSRAQQNLAKFGELPTAGELLGLSEEDLVLILIQLRRRQADTHHAIEQCCVQIHSIEECLTSLQAMDREDQKQKLESLKDRLSDLEEQRKINKPKMDLVIKMLKLGKLYPSKTTSTIERLERNHKLRQKILAEYAEEQRRWLNSTSTGRPIESEASRSRVAELMNMERELADESNILKGLKSEKQALDAILTEHHDISHAADFDPLSELPSPCPSVHAEMMRLNEMLAYNAKRLEETMANTVILENQLHQLRQSLPAQRMLPPSHSVSAALLDVTKQVNEKQSELENLQKERRELSQVVHNLTQLSQLSKEQRSAQGIPGRYTLSELDRPLYVDTRPGSDFASPLDSEDLQPGAFVNLSNGEKPEIKTVRIVKRESERRQRDRERSLHPMSDWSASNLSLPPVTDWSECNVADLEQYLEDEIQRSQEPYTPISPRSASLPRVDYGQFREHYSKLRPSDPFYYGESNLDLSPRFGSSPSLSNYDYAREFSAAASNYNKRYDKDTKSSYDRGLALSKQFLNRNIDEAIDPRPSLSISTIDRPSLSISTLDTLPKSSNAMSLTRPHMELSPIFKSEAAKQIITEMSGEPKGASLHRRQVPKEKRRHNTAPHHLISSSTKALNEMPQSVFGYDNMARARDDADMERALRTAIGKPDVVSAALPTPRYADSIDQLLAAPQKIRIPERLIPENPPELTPEEILKRQEKVESIKKMLSGSSADPSKSPDGEEKRQREHLLQMNQLLAKQVTEMSKIIAVKAVNELSPDKETDPDDCSPDVELPIYQQRDNFFS